MTPLESLLRQIDHLSADEQAAVRKHLEKGRPDSVTSDKNGMDEQSSPPGKSKTRLWGLFSHNAEELDSIVESLLQARQYRPMRLP